MITRQRERTYLQESKLGNFFCARQAYCEFNFHRIAQCILAGSHQQLQDCCQGEYRVLEHGSECHYAGSRPAQSVIDCMIVGGVGGCYSVQRAIRFSNIETKASLPQVAESCPMRIAIEFESAEFGLRICQNVFHR